MRGEAAAHLFDDQDGFPQGPVSPGSSDPSRALALDHRPTLVDGSEPALPARRVRLHSRDKAHYARYYADIVGRAMRTAYGGPLAWIELFAGPGELYVQDTGKFEPGSAQEAVNIAEPFDKYVFVDLDKRCVEALRVRVGLSDRVHCIQGDANSPDVHDEIVQIVPRNSLVVLYADPAGLELEFDTIKFFARRYRHLDLLLNFPVQGVLRALRANQDKKASRMLDHPAPVELIAPGSPRSSRSIRDYFESKLRELGYDNFDREVIKFFDTNSPLYDLMIASREPRAIQFFQEAKKRGPGGQYSFDLGAV